MTPLFAHLLGVRPWEMELLTHEQFLDCEAWITNQLKG